MNPTISLIIPVYNPGERLKRALKAVSAQTFGDYELILVDDGSTDGASDILAQYASNDPRAQIITQPNSGASAARNAGIVAAKGEWIVFCDADDCPTPEYLSGLIADYEKDQSVDMVIQGVVWHGDDHGSNLSCDEDKSYDVDLRFRERWLDLPHIHLTAPYAKLIARDLLIRNGIRFKSTINKLEDFEFLIQCLISAKRVRMSSTINYIYDYHPGSLSRTIYSYESEVADMEQLLDAFIALAPGVDITRHFEAHDVFQRGIRRIYAANNHTRYTRAQRLRNLRSIPPRQVRLFRSYPGGNILLRTLRALTLYPILLDPLNQLLYHTRWSRQQHFA